MLKTTITFETKKNNPVTTIWGIKQCRPYPIIDCSGGWARWQNAEGLVPPWRLEGCPRDLPTIGAAYDCWLLRNDTNLHDSGSRVSHAGWVDDKTGFVAPGSFELRGETLGEVQVKINKRIGWNLIAVRGHNDPTPGERDFINEKIVPHLKEVIDGHAALLKHEATCALRRYVIKGVAELRESLRKAETEMEAAIASVEKN